ncbi:MAG: ATP-binding protein [Dehalococcoidales bacterium]|nr:ATP-binding protein [Dehalococcoidales bacterium]
MYITAYTDEDTVQRAKMTQPYGYIVKPFNEREVRVAVDMALYKHQMERKLKESEEWFSTTLNSIGDAVIAVDRNSLVTFMNPVAEQLTGWPHQEAVNRTLAEVFQIVNRDTRRTAENPVTRVFREGNVIGLANHTILIARDGREISIDDSAAPIKDNGGNIFGVVLVFRDVTDRGKADKLKDDFIGMISHELRTPLTVVLGAVLTALSEGITIEQTQELLKDAASSADSMSHLIDNLIELTRYQANRLSLSTESLDIDSVVKQVVEHEKPHLNSHRISLDIPEKLPPVKGDRVRLEQILRNLLDNAAKYSADNTEIRVSVKEKKPYIMVGVSDQGKGISADEQKKLFQPFERLGHSSTTSRGLGLGLVVCKHLTEAQGGRIWVESKPGKGSTFWFTLPLSKTSA